MTFQIMSQEQASKSVNLRRLAVKGTMQVSNYSAGATGMMEDFYGGQNACQMEYIMPKCLENSLAS